MIGIRLEPALEKRLERLAKETGRSKSHYVREAVKRFLEEREDYLKAIAVLEREESSISLKELGKRLGLEG